MSIIEDKGISYINNIIDGRIDKFGKSKNGDIDVEFLNFHKDPTILLEIISDITKSINGEFSAINDPDISNNFQIAFITSTNIEYYDYDGKEIIAISSLSEFKEKATAWRNFLLTSPFLGESIPWWKRIFDI
jgi:hypothetical protein